jgi:hypothetical protein
MHRHPELVEGCYTLYMKKHRASSQDDVTLSDLLGSTLAIAQHGIDLAVTGLFKRLKETGNSPRPAIRKGGKALQTVSDFTRGFVGFIGKTGDSYMETYEKLKEEQAHKKQS